MNCELNRVLLLDGAMGTMLQKKGFKGNYDALSLTNPDAIADVHRQYLEAGADIIETCTFNAQRISQREYGLTDKVREMNLAAAGIARREADRMTALTPDQPRFVAGSVGPTNQSLSISPDIDRPEFRSIDFDTLCDAYTEQMTALIEGGVDALLIETIFDSLNAQAALAAARKAFETTGKKVPVMLSATIADAAGRLLSGQTLEAFLISVSNADIYSFGLNCAFGAAQMKPYLKTLAEISPFRVSAYPNAGLPNEMGEYEQTPEEMAKVVSEFVEEGLVDIVGGCCGTTPEHIKALRTLKTPPNLPFQGEGRRTETSGGEGRRTETLKGEGLCSLLLSGNDVFRGDGHFINIGERCNVAGSRKFLRLINEKSYDEALQIARKQVDDGAMILDVNMDDGMLDARNEMVNFLNLMGSDPEIARIPWMIDSSQFDVIEAALKCIQGKPIVNSLSLKEGETVFLERAKRVKELGAALVVMAFDEDGQATTYDKKISVCRRAYDLLTEKIGFNPNDIIFDPNVLTVATGMKEHDRYALDFIEATRWIHENLKGAKVSGGISNLSFAFRGNNYIREAMHAVFLYHAIRAGLDMAIINPASKVMYQDIPADLLEALEDVILCRRDDATERLVNMAAAFAEMKTGDVRPSADTGKPETEMTVGERLQLSLQKGSEEHLQEDIEEALKAYPSAADIIEGPLMDGMSRVGELFGEGMMFLPQVIKTARTMKSAIEILKPYLEKSERNQKSETAEAEKSGRPKYILATVKGDVHDIGKNIAGVVLACNNFDVIDLGVMVPAEKIVETAMREKADFICLSGLITPSLAEMCNVAGELKKAGVSVPLFISGATTSELHTATKIAPLYDGPVFHLKDASQNPVVAMQLMGDERDELIAELRGRQEALRSETAQRQKALHANGCQCCQPCSGWKVAIEPTFLGTRNIDIPIHDVRPFINWIHFYNLWKLKTDEQRQSTRQEAETILDRIEGRYGMKATVGFFKAHSSQDSIFADGVELNVPQRLASFVAPEGHDDHIGVFAVTVCKELAEEMQGDIMLQSIADRLAEATSEYLHMKVRRDLWGYAKDEDITIDEMYKAHYQGIRPAVGYSSFPDQRQIFRLAQLVDFDSVGISLTENGAMYPQSSVCGIYIANPDAKYF